MDVVGNRKPLVREAETKRKKLTIMWAFLFAKNVEKELGYDEK